MERSRQALGLRAGAFGRVATTNAHPLLKRVQPSTTLSLGPKPVDHFARAAKSDRHSYSLIRSIKNNNFCQEVVQQQFKNEATSNDLRLLLAPDRRFSPLHPVLSLSLSLSLTAWCLQRRMLRRPIKAAACLQRSARDLLPCTSSIKNAMSSGTPLGSDEDALSSADNAASVLGGPKSLHGGGGGGRGRHALESHSRGAWLGRGWRRRGVAKKQRVMIAWTELSLPDPVLAFRRPCLQDTSRGRNAKGGRPTEAPRRHQKRTQHPPMHPEERRPNPFFFLLPPRTSPSEKTRGG